jgi:hypothetical protein
MESCSIATAEGLSIGFDAPLDYFYTVYRTSGSVTVEWNMPRENHIWLQNEREQALAHYAQLGLVECY